MNAIKFQQDLIKDILKNNRLFSYFCNANKIYISLEHPDKYFIIGIKLYDFCIRYGKGREYFKIEMDLDYIGNGATDAITTGKPKTIDKHIYIEFRNKDGDKLYIDKKLLDYFKSNNLTYKASYNSLYIFELGELVGVIGGMKASKEC